MSYDEKRRSTVERAFQMSVTNFIQTITLGILDRF